MIEFLMIYPLVAAVIIYFVNSKILNNILMILYSTLYLIFNIYFLFSRPDSVLKTYFAFDNINQYFFIILAILFFCVSIYNIGYHKNSEKDKKTISKYYICLFIFIFSMTGFLLSQHLGLLWVFIEATTLATAYLIYFDKTKEALRATWKYIFICSIGISFAFVGIILLSKGVGGGHTNSLFFDNLYKNAKQINPFWLQISFVFIVLGFGTKMGLAPMHSWLPEAHSEAPSPVSAMLSGTLLNMAFLGILRIYKVMILSGNLHKAQIIIMTLGFLSLLFSAAFIVKISNYKKMLAYSSIENMGIVSIGLSLGPNAIFAVFLHLAGHSFTKALLFITSGNILRRYKTKDINKISGLFFSDKLTAIFWLLGFLSIVALPPFPLFISEFLIIKEFVAQKMFIQIILFTLILTFIMFGLANSFLKMLFGEKNQEMKDEKLNIFCYLPQIILVLLLLGMGVIIPGEVVDFIRKAGDWLYNL